MKSISTSKFTITIVYLYALFLLATGIMTIYFHFGDVDFSKGTSAPTVKFMSDIKDSGYIILWLGIFKTITGILMLFKQTVKVAILMSVPYVVNILLYVYFISFADYLSVALFDGAACFYLCYAYWPQYKYLFEK